MKSIWLGLACGFTLLAAPLASAQDLNAAVQAYNCGAPTQPPAAPHSEHPSARELQAFAEQANAWQTAQQAIGQCMFAAQHAMDQRTTARVDEYNQHVNQNRQAATAWQTSQSAHH
jgi:hypothetical protein